MTDLRFYVPIHSIQNRLIRQSSSQPICWLELKKHNERQQHTKRISKLTQQAHEMLNLKTRKKNPKVNDMGGVTEIDNHAISTRVAAVSI